MAIRILARALALAAATTAAASLSGTASAIDLTWRGSGPAAWAGDLSPLAAQDWNYDKAQHLLERAGFGGTPEEIDRLAKMTPEQAVRLLVHADGVDNKHLKPFQESGVWDPTLANFPKSRVDATADAYKKGESMGIKVKPEGNRKLQPVVDRFFFWLRATVMETRRLGYWWADRMVASNAPLEEKMALFWHGHFATGENKIRDYRKMMVQLDTLHSDGLGNFRTLLTKIAQDPAMLAYLDAGENVKGSPNENFGREVMELFTMGVGNYTEKDIREAARAFTGWTADDKTLKFVVLAEKHDDTPKSFLGKTGNFDGTDILAAILEQKVTAEWVGGKIYKYFVREDITPETRGKVGDLFRNANYEIKPLMIALLLSKDFYSQPSMATRIKSPVELTIGTYRKLGLKEVPGIPDFTDATETLGQILLNPPTVAGWAQGRAWITPASLLERGNFARDVLFPDTYQFRDPLLYGGENDRRTDLRLRAGLNYTAATIDPAAMAAGDMNQANITALAEDFNTRVASTIAWTQAAAKVIPIPRRTAAVDLSRMLREANVKNADDAVDLMLRRFLSVRPAARVRDTMVKMLKEELGTNDLATAATYVEAPLRLLLHMILSTPEYQLG